MTEAAATNAPAAATRQPQEKPPVLADPQSSPNAATANAAGPAACAVPMARVKRLCKEDPDVDKLASDAVLAISAATEVFLEYFIQHAWQYTRRDKRRTVQYRDLGASSICIFRRSFDLLRVIMLDYDFS